MFHGAMKIFCTQCKKETPAEKLSGPAPAHYRPRFGKSRVLWWNTCLCCSSRYEGLAPASGREETRRQRALERRHGQQQLFEPTQ